MAQGYLGHKATPSYAFGVITLRCHLLEKGGRP